ncbi:MAG: glycosyltransferase [Acidobacteriota bacterium]|nr:glycosyltransferase [Acidobacteriota bacterium]MDE3265005.1 glycosyltransferase [Acidobacteriota bacterium]
MTGRPLRWLFFYDCIYPESVGGVEHRNYELARELGRLGHEVLLSGWAESPAEPHPNVRVQPVARASRRYVARGRRSGIEALTLASQVRRIPLDGVDIVETANIPYLHLPLLARRCRRRRIPLLVTWHEHWGRYWREHRPPGPFSPGMWRLYALCEHWSARFGTQAAAVSRLTADRVSTVRGETVDVIPNGIPFERIRTLAADADATAPPLVYAGRLIPEKRIDLLLDATARLAATETGRKLATERGALLRIIGGGPAEDDLRAHIERENLNAIVDFAGRLPENEDVWRAVAGARLAVQPSAREGFGLFPLEAMAAGVPVVHCRSPNSAVSELVRDGREGWAVDPHAGDLTGLLERLLAEPGELAAASSSAVERAAGYDWRQVAARVIEAGNVLVRRERS